MFKFRTEWSNLQKWIAKTSWCKEKFKAWNRSSQRNNIRQIEILSEELCYLQEDWNKNIHKVSQIKEQINENGIREEQYWHLSSWIRWLTHGDANTSFFHQIAIQMRRQNRISRIMNDHGSCSLWWQNGAKNNWRLFQKYSSSGPRNWGSAINCIEKVVTLQMNLELIQPVLLKKVKKAAFEMGSLKATGPNGFQGTFY